MPQEVGFLRDFAIIMAVAGAALVLCRRLGQPPILGYLLAGVVVGPYALPHPPVENIGTVRMLANLGLVLLLFALGLEFGWERIRRVGLRVVFIGAVEIGFMMVLGYETGLLLGWTSTEAIFLGAALSISSSAVLAKVLRDAGRLHTTSGRLIVGILVVEDFAAVILITLLSAIGTTGTADFGDVGLLVGKLVLFGTAVLTLGGILAPRLLDLVARYRSQEAMLITSLALCFTLAIVGEELGISAAAGAFLMGTVLGDTEHAREIARVMTPVRDMFAAIFFVSIGMLVDISTAADFIGPALIISAVFIVGKVLADTVATFMTGHDGRTSLAVGMGMPQVGEFSLAMVKVGVERMAVSASLYPVIAVTTALTSFVFPYVFRSSDTAARFLERRSPRLLSAYVWNLSGWLASLRAAFALQGEFADQLRQSGRGILLSTGIIAVILAVGTVTLGFTATLAERVGIREDFVGLVVGSTVVALCIPPVVGLWRALSGLADRLSLHALRRGGSARVWQREGLRLVLANTFLIAATGIIAVWSLPLVSKLLFLGRFAAPVPALLLTGAVALMARTAFRIHGVLEETFARTFYGSRPGEPGQGPDGPE